MLKEIVYWTYRFFSNLRRSQKKKDDDGRWDSAMFVSVCLFTNVLTLLNVLEKHSNIAILEKIPITTKYEFSSWVCIILIMIPFIAIVYSRYFRKDKLSKNFGGICGEIQETVKVWEVSGLLLYSPDMGGILYVAGLIKASNKVYIVKCYCIIIICNVIVYGY